MDESGFTNAKPIFNGLASAISVLTNDDFEHGVLVINIGAGTTEYTIFNKYLVMLTGVLPVGGDHLANDLYLGLDINYQKAVEIIISNCQIWNS